MKRRVDDAGRDGVESNMLFRVFRSQTSHRRVQTAFRDHGKRSSYASDWIICEGSRDTDDAASGLLCLHLLNRKLRHVDEPKKVSRDQPAKVVCRMLGEGFDQVDAGIRDHGINRAEPL